MTMEFDPILGRVRLLVTSLSSSCSGCRSVTSPRRYPLLSHVCSSLCGLVWIQPQPQSRSVSDLGWFFVIQCPDAWMHRLLTIPKIWQGNLSCDTLLDSDDDGDDDDNDSLAYGRLAEKKRPSLLVSLPFRTSHHLIIRAMAHLMPFMDINLHTSDTQYAFTSPSHPASPTLIVDRPSGDLRLSDAKVTGAKRVASIAGILGIIKLRLGQSCGSALLEPTSLATMFTG